MGHLDNENVKYECYIFDYIRLYYLKQLHMLNRIYSVKGKYADVKIQMLFNRCIVNCNAVVF